MKKNIFTILTLLTLLTGLNLEAIRIKPSPRDRLTFIVYNETDYDIYCAPCNSKTLRYQLIAPGDSKVFRSFDNHLFISKNGKDAVGQSVFIKATQEKVQHFYFYGLNQVLSEPKTEETTS